MEKTQCAVGLSLSSRAGLARTGRHNEQRFAAVAFPEALADGFDGSDLIVASGDGFVDRDAVERLTHGAEVEKFFKVALGVNRGNAPLGVLSVNDAGVESVGEEDDRAHAVLFLQTVGVFFCLLSADGRIDAGLFCLDQGERPTVVAEKHIIDIAGAGLVHRHAGHGNLIQPVFALDPARVGEHGVNVELAGFVLGGRKRVRGVGLLLLFPVGGHLRFKVLQSRVFIQNFLQFFFRNHRHGRRLLRSLRLGERRVKGALQIVVLGRAVAVEDEIRQIKEIFQTMQRAQSPA